MTFNDFLHYKFYQENTMVDGEKPVGFDEWYDSRTVDQMEKYNKEYEKRMSEVN